MSLDTAARAALRPLPLCDLRVQCRARGLSPAGGKDALTERLVVAMVAAGETDLKPDPAAAPPAAAAAVDDGPAAPAAHSNNNYARPGGQQNVGNFVTGRPTSRVLAPPGGASQISFG